jgi:hypothetical protein
MFHVLAIHKPSLLLIKHIKSSNAIMDILPRGNDALNVNPPIDVSEALSQHGSDWLWAVTALYITTFVSATIIQTLKTTKTWIFLLPTAYDRYTDQYDLGPFHRLAYWVFALLFVRAIGFFTTF